MHYLSKDDNAIWLRGRPDADARLLEVHAKQLGHGITIVEPTATSKPVIKRCSDILDVR
ncbi:hypothetical protein DPMN_069367 [Dreissena polymorpha]|uniref:Uncharacterized protein n=1 Tax=Dreissena polymorpha TaxID=45954 RepID=A0A9D3Z3Z8_DREPO|nr:hypothetical protein DPMN_069367 [Dreissena polymorpha]